MIHEGVKGFGSGDGVKGEIEIGLTGLVSSGSSHLPQGLGCRKLKKKGSESLSKSNCVAYKERAKSLEKSRKQDPACNKAPFSPSIQWLPPMRPYRCHPFGSLSRWRVPGNRDQCPPLLSLLL